MSLRFRCRSSACKRKFHPVGKKICVCGAAIPHEYWFFRKIAGKRHHKFHGEGTRVEVDAAHKKWLNELNHGLTAPPPQRVLLQEVSDTYIRYLESSGKRYAYESQLFLDRLIEYVGNIPAVSLTVDQLSRWQTELRSMGLSPAYVDRHLQVGKAAWNRTLPDLPNPFKRVKLFKPDNIVIERLTPEEEKKLLLAAQCLDGNCPWHFYEIMVVAIHTGMRMRNILHLHRSEVDFENRLITVRQKRNRILRVRMNSVVYEALRGIKPLKGGTGWFFPSLFARGKPLDRVEKSFQAAKKLAGITRPFRFHGLRHHFASKLLASTKNVLLVQQAMDHSDIRTTMKYVHVLDHELRDALETLVVPPPGQPR